MTDRLHRLFNAQRIAVFGSSWATNVVEQLQRGGFGGEIWPVHPKRATLADVPAFRSIDALPGVPDCAFIGVNRAATIEVLAQLSTAGCGGAVCFASGFSESGDTDLQAALVAAAGDMPVLGPNCYGVLNYFDGIALWPDQHGGLPCETGVGLISQSSNIAINLTMNTRGLPIGKVACVGNGALVGVAELATHMIADPRISAVGFYLEGFGDAQAFARMAQDARAARKPLVAIKAGRTAAARDAAASHTAALAGDGVVSSAFLRQCGVAEARDLAELVETLKVQHVLGSSVGTAICTLSCSGGEAGLIADAADGMGLSFPSPDAAQTRDLGATLGPLVTITNPLDYHTFIWGDEDRLTDVYAAMLRDTYDLGVLVMDLPHAGRCDADAWAPSLAALRRARARTGTPTALLTTLPECLPEPLARDLIADGIVPLCGLREGLRAIEIAASTAEMLDWTPLAPVATGPTTLVSEADAKARLALAGISVPTRLSGDPSLPGPFAVKALGLAHKTDAGGVALGVTRDDLDAVLARLPGDDFLVEAMVPDVVAEMLVTVRRDPVCGATLTIGFGGVEAELFADTVTLILPVRAAEIDAALRRLRMFARLDGFRGRPRADLVAVVDVAQKLAAMIASDPTLVEIEINPLMVRAADAVAADALMHRMETP